MRLKLDENLSRYLQPILSRLHHDVTTVHDENLLSRPDTAIAEAARNEERMLFTLDVEFGNLSKYPPGTHPGIILFRPGTLGPIAVNRFVEEFVSKTDLKELAGCIVIVEPMRVRVRRLPLAKES